MTSLSCLDPAFLFRCIRGIPSDNFESYADGVDLNGLMGGKNEWAGVNPYVARDNFAGVKSEDDFESYSDGADLDALNGGTGWTGAYEARETFTGIKGFDDMESYSDGAGIDGLNGGTGWTGAYVGR